MQKRITIRMPKEDLEMVLAMLRNPRNQSKQGRGSLFNTVTQGYCCLGAMQCAKTGGFVEYNYNDGLPAGLPTLEWLQSVGWTFRDRHGRRRESPYLPMLGDNASYANDVLHKTFTEIADAIEDCAEGY